MSNAIYESLSEERKSTQAAGLTPHWYSTGGFQMFKQKYLYKTDSVFGQFERISTTLARHLPDSKRALGEDVFLEMLWEGILSPSTPVLANTGTDRGFTISCAGNYTEDSVDGFYRSKHETAMLTKMGFGTSSYVGGVRPRGSMFQGGGKASGVAPLLGSFINDMQLVSQGSNRRGAFAGYLEIDHGDFDEVCDKLLVAPDDFNIGWVIRDSFLAKLEAGDPDALRRYRKVLKTKLITGRGYFWFVDRANRKLPQVYKDRGLKNYASNLCSEILLPASEKYTFSCVLSSLNLVHWERIKASIGTDRNYIYWAMMFLNCLIDEFLKQSEGQPGFDKIRAFTAQFRATGLGVCGYHTLLMQKRIPWESLEANWLNLEIFETIDKETKSFSNLNASRIAIAPTKSTALLMGGISEGINPVPAFTFTQSTAAGDVDRIDPILLSLMKERGVNIEEAIKDVTKAFGSVQGVSWLDEHEKKVFKTAFEIDQRAVLRHALMRAQFIDQWQSINLFFSADEKEEVISSVHKEAFLDERCVGLYYLHTLAGVPASSGECEACQ